VVAPAGCLGGPGVLAALDRGIPIIAVEANVAALNVGAEALGLPSWSPGGAAQAAMPAAPAALPVVLHARSYFEAAGLLLAMRAGVDPATCDRPLAGILALAGGAKALSSP
jgi:hypothetical protein